MSNRWRGLVGTWRASVFWRVAAVLLAIQLLAVAAAVALSSWAAYDRAIDLAAEGLRLRLDAVAEEVEDRVDWTGDGLGGLPAALVDDLSVRFPDPVTVVDAEGMAVVTVAPRDQDGPLSSVDVPANLGVMLEGGTIVFPPSREWMAAPIYDDVGFLAGGLLVRPIRRSLARELQPARTALVRALVLSALIVLALALLMAASFTWSLVGPLREMTEEVEAIGRGDYSRRVESTGPDELGRLGETINRMARRVAVSIEELQATDRMRRELVANVGHDLRTPIAAVLGRVDESRRLLEENRADEARAHLEAARKQADYLTRLVDDLFELAVLDAPSPPLRLEPVPIGELIRDVAGQYADSLRERNIELEVRLGPDVPVLRADGLRLLRLFSNLLSNAYRHTPDGGRILIEATRDGEAVRVRIVDSGAGVEPGTVETLFERYYRGTDARTRLTEGTGLGLPISRAIAIAHGGHLTAENGPESGAVFTLTLPLEQAGDPPGAEA